MFFATLYYDSEWFKNDVNGAQLFLSTNVTGTTLSDSIKKTAKGKSSFYCFLSDSTLLRQQYISSDKACIFNKSLFARMHLVFTEPIRLTVTRLIPIN